MSTGYGRISSINRIPSYSSRKGRTYRGVKTGKMVANIGIRLAKAQDTSMKNQFDNGQISADSYSQYLTSRIAQTSDPTYQVTLTQELQNAQTTTNDQAVLDGEAAGTISPAQVAAYYQAKLSGLTPGNPDYTKTQAAVAKWNTTADTQSYKLQESVLKGQEAGAADQLPAAQKLLDFYVQYLQKLSPNSPEYDNTVQAIGTYQAKVRQLSFNQSLLQAEDKISQTYNKNTPEDWSAKAQMYQQLRDASAQQGDTTNFYKYDQLANNATDAATKAQSVATTKQITDAIHQVRSDYISGKIDGNTAQQQLMQIGDFADANGDTTGSILVHDMYDSVGNDLNRGVTYGGDNGYGKTKGGSGGDSGWFDLSGNTPIEGGIGKSVNAAISGGSSTSSPSSGSGSTSSSPTSPGSSDLLTQILNAAKVSNPTQSIIEELNNAQENGATFQDMVDLLRVKKIGTGDGYKAIQDIQKSTASSLNNALHLGYDPTTGVPFTPGDYRQALLANNTVLAQQYGAWQSYIEANPKAKISLNGKNVQVGTLSDNIDKTLNGTTKIDPLTGLEIKDTPGLMDSIANLQNSNDFAVVEDPKNPGQFIAASKAAFEAQNGTLASKYIQDENGVYHSINSPTPQEATFTNEKDATSYAKAHNIDPAGIGMSKGQFIVYVPTGQKNVTVQGPNGQKIMYILNPDNTVSKVQSTKGALPSGFAPNKIMSFGGAQLSVPSDKMGFKSPNGQTLSVGTKKAPANFSTAYGPRNASAPMTYPYSPVPNNTSTSNGATYTPSPKDSGLNYSPVPNGQNFSSVTRPLFSSSSQVGSKVVAPGQPILQNPLDVLIGNIIKPIKPVQPVTVPQNAPLNLSSSQQQQFRSAGNAQQVSPRPQQNPVSSSAPLQNVGAQPQSPLQQSGIKVNLGSFPSANNQPAPSPSNWISNIGSSIGNAVGGAEKAVGNFFGGFHF